MRARNDIANAVDSLMRQLTEVIAWVADASSGVTRADVGLHIRGALTFALNGVATQRLEPASNPPTDLERRREYLWSALASTEAWAIASPAAEVGFRGGKILSAVLSGYRPLWEVTRRVPWMV